MDVTGHRILIFGDSLSHPGSDKGPEIFELPTTAGSASMPGARLGQRLLDAGASAVRIDARVGRSAHNFFGRESYAKLLSSDQTWSPTIVLVMLGTNDIGLNMRIDGVEMAKIRDAFSSSTVISAGPPAFASSQLTHGAEAVYEMLHAVFMTVIDARPLSSTAASDRAGDGVHFTAAGAKKLATGLFAAITALGADTDTDTSAGTAKKIVLGVGLTALAAGLAWIIGRRIALASTPRASSRPPLLPSRSRSWRQPA